MSGATPKHQAKEPIDLDIILVCRKTSHVSRHAPAQDVRADTTKVAGDQVSRLRESGRALSRNDVRVIVVAQLVRHLSEGSSAADATKHLHEEEAKIEATITRLATGKGVT
jgi:hypothetical protein